MARYSSCSRVLAGVTKCSKVFHCCHMFLFRTFNKFRKTINKVLILTDILPFTCAIPLVFMRVSMTICCPYRCSQGWSWNKEEEFTILCSRGWPHTCCIDNFELRIPLPRC